jgi:uncharacterized protein
MRYLIDGYNLLHALGLARKTGGKAQWDQSRRLLLDWLAEQHAASPGDVTVAFDAQKGFGNQLIEESHRGLRVLRKPGRSADDLIEELIATEPDPASLTVVSNDTRVRDAASRGRCLALKCDEYVDAVMKLPAARRVPSHFPEEKDLRETPADKAEWLKVFGG